MKAKQRKELQAKTVAELKNLLKESKAALFSLSMEKMQAKLKNTTAIYTKRKEIARILTHIQVKEAIK